MLIPRRIQLAQSNDLQCFHLWSALAPGTAGLGGPELKKWVAKLLKRLAGAHAVQLQGFSLEADQFHLVLQWTPQAASQWSDAEVQRRWLLAHPPRKAVDANDPNALPTMSVPLAKARARLASLSGFLQLFKQLITFKINRETKHRGTIWQGRFKLAPLPDASAVAGALAFVDLLPVIKGDGQLPEESPFSSLHARVALYKAKFGMPPYGHLLEPDGEWTALAAEVTAELRRPEAEQMPQEMPGTPPPNENPLGEPMLDPMGNPMGGSASDPPMSEPIPPPSGLPEVPDDGMAGMGGVDVMGGTDYMNNPMPTGASAVHMPNDPMAVPPMSPPAPWTADVPVGNAAPSGAGTGALWSSGEPDLPWFSLRQYLKLLDALVTTAKAWPHLPSDAPGRALTPKTPAWAGAIEELLQGLHLVPAAFEAQWQRLARLRV